MKTIKKILIVTLLSIVSNGYIYCQTIEWNEDYTYTVFYDDFSNSLIDLNKWCVEDDAYLHHTLFIDSSATVNVDAGKLRLTMGYLKVASIFHGNRERQLILI